MAIPEDAELMRLFLPSKTPAMPSRSLRVAYAYDPYGVLWRVTQWRPGSAAD